MFSGQERGPARDSLEQYSSYLQHDRVGQPLLDDQSQPLPIGYTRYCRQIEQQQNIGLPHQFYIHDEERMSSKEPLGFMPTSVMKHNFKQTRTVSYLLLCVRACMLECMHMCVLSLCACLHMYLCTCMGEISNVFTVQVPEMNEPLTRLEQGVHVYYLWLHIIKS